MDVPARDARAPARRRVLAASLAVALLAPGAAPAQEAGRIEGVATIAPRLASQRQRIRVYAEPGAAAARPPAEHPFTGVVVYLESAPALAAVARPAQPAVMRQREERFVPRVLPVVVGTAVDFPNDDPIYHNVFSLSRARTFDLGRYARGQSKSVRFQAAGIVQVFCHIHADMAGTILVLDHPFFALPDSTGRFVLEGVPPGTYRLVGWHDRARPVRTDVRVEAGRTATVQVAIPLAEAPATP